MERVRPTFLLDLDGILDSSVVAHICIPVKIGESNKCLQLLYVFIITREIVCTITFYLLVHASRLDLAKSCLFASETQFLTCFFFIFLIIFLSHIHHIIKNITIIISTNFLSKHYLYFVTSNGVIMQLRE